MNEIDKINQILPDARRTRKSGGSVILTLTNFAQENELYMLKKDGNDIILTNIRTETVEKPENNKE